MEVVTIHNAKTTLSQLLARVEAGEEIVIARGDKPIAKLTPYEAVQPKRQPGRWKGQFGDIGPDVFAPMTDEELADWGL